MRPLNVDVSGSICDTLFGGDGDDAFRIYFHTDIDNGNDTILDFGNGKDIIVLSGNIEQIQSIMDLDLRQQEDDSLLIDLTSHGGGTITLLDYEKADLAITIREYDIFIYHGPNGLPDGLDVL